MTMRLMLFPDRPDTLLVHSDDGEVRLPTLTAPFDKVSVTSACKAAGLDVRVIESVPGRWTFSMSQARQAKMSELRQRENLRIATLATQLRGSDSPLLQDRSQALLRKADVDTEISETKLKLSAAKDNLRIRGKYMDTNEYRRLEKKFEILKQESQSLQTRLGELRDAQKKINIAATESRDSRFRRLAKEILDPEEYQDLYDAAEHDEE